MSRPKMGSGSTYSGLSRGAVRIPSSSLGLLYNQEISVHCLIMMFILASLGLSNTMTSLRSSYRQYDSIF